MGDERGLHAVGDVGPAADPAAEHDQLRVEQRLHGPDRRREDARLVVEQRLRAGCEHHARARRARAGGEPGPAGDRLERPERVVRRDDVVADRQLPQLTGRAVRLRAAPARR